MNKYAAGAALIVIIGIGVYLALNYPGGFESSLPPEKFEETTANYSISADYPTDTPLKDSASAQADSRAVREMRNFIAQTVTEFKVLTDPDRETALQIVYLISTSPRTISYIFTINDYTGGAHGNTRFRTFTYDTKTGEPLGIGALFKENSDYLGKLSGIAQAKLPQIIGSAADTQAISAGTEPQAENFANFFIGGNTLGILFPPYQVAAYAAGPQTLPIALADLADILKPEYIAP